LGTAPFQTMSIIEFGPTLVNRKIIDFVTPAIPFGMM